jgi:hypothetical protein
MQKYSVNQLPIEILLAWVNSGEIAIPEIQRPFVWDSSKVRNLMDSLYNGFPVGYVIAWRNPNIKLKDGSTSEGKKILIDGQQRITALTAAILGKQIVNDTYQKVRIKIAFNPIEERFEVQNSAILKNKTWLPDISKVLNGDLYEFIEKYFEANTEIDKQKVRPAFSKLKDILKNPIGIIELAPDLDIETVTEIFIRINAQGVVLSQADFAMSKIAANSEYGGNTLRKAIDYFCHLAISPEFYHHIEENDNEFAVTEFYQKMKWLKSENEDLYDPEYTDLIKVAFTSQFNRGKLSDLVSLLSGRNFETRTFEDTIAEQSFATLKKGVLNFMNETNFKRFLMIIKSAGFISPKLIRSKSALNFCYILYLKLRDLNVESVKIESYVRRWFVLSILTGRYSGSAESIFDYDIKQIAQQSFDDYLKENEEGSLSEAYWNVVLPQSLNTSASAFNSPYFQVYLASQVKANDKGFLSSDITVSDLINHRGDIHHLFPKDYLKRNGMERGKYNQIANFVFMQTEINIKLGNKAPKEYFGIIKNQIAENTLHLSGISSEEQLSKNLNQHCIPTEITQMDATQYEEFLTTRRQLMANKMKEYYFSL